MNKLTMIQIKTKEGHRSSGLTSDDLCEMEAMEEIEVRVLRRMKAPAVSSERRRRKASGRRQRPPKIEIKLAIY
jgi:hypothetical protein